MSFCRTDVFPITFRTGLQMETQIVRWSTFKHGAQCKALMASYFECVVGVFVELFCFEQFEDVESKSCIVRLLVEQLNGYRAQRRLGLCAFVAPEATAADGPGKAPEAKRRFTWQRNTAASRLQSFCFRKASRWTPRTTMAWGLKSGKHAPDIESRPWGTSKSNLGSVIRRQYPKMCGEGLQVADLNHLRGFRGLKVEKKSRGLGNSVFGSMITT